MSLLDARRFPLHGSRLVEASAGTGKTYTIAALYLRLVLGHGAPGEAFVRPLIPPEILVVTFTEAATEELRERIRARLAEAAQVFRGLRAPDPFLAGLLADYPPADWPGRARLLEQAGQWMDEAAIYTIHGWCNRMLREHAFDSGSLFSQELVTDDSERIARVLADYWRSHVLVQPRAALDTLDPLFRSRSAFAQAVKSLLAQTEQLPLAVDGLRPGAWLDDARTLLRGHLQGLKQDWAVWAPELRGLLERAKAEGELVSGFRIADRLKWLGLLEAWASDPEALALPKLSDTAWKGLAPQGWQASFRDGVAVPEHPGPAALAGLPLRAPTLTALLLTHAARWAASRLAREREACAQVTFDDMLHRLDAALDPARQTALAQVLASQFPIALVDEFQDTDPIQYRIFERIYLDAEHAPDRGLFLIGDPKQAIYSFRGADIHTYLAARAATAGRHYSLGTNYRSTETLVRSVNAVFQFAERTHGSAFALATGEGTELAFEAVSARGRDEVLWVEEAAPPALSLCPVEPDRSLSKPRYLAASAEVAASEIVRLLNLAQAGRAGFCKAGDWQALCAADIAILVRDRTEAAAMRRALQRRGLRSVYLSDRDSVFATREAEDVLRWLKAVAEPGNTRLVRAALATGTLALAWDALARLHADDLQWEEKQGRFLRYHGLWQRLGVLPMLRALLADFEVASQLLTRPEGERSLTNVLHLAELLQARAQDREGEHALIRYLADEIEVAGEGEVKEHVLRLESDAELIKLVTIHKSKGLEYPLVFLPFIAASKPLSRRNRTAFSYVDADQGRRLDLNLSDEAMAGAEAERLQEDIRLLYVALTRARHGCWLGLNAVKELAGSGLGYVLAGGRDMDPAGLTQALVALAEGEPGIALVPAQVSDQGYQAQAETRGLGPARAYAGTRPAPWWIASYSALKLAAAGEMRAPASEPEAGSTEPEAPASAGELNLLAADEAVPEEAVTGADIHGFPRGAAPGTFLHELLEWAAKAGFGVALRDGDARRQAVRERCESAGWPDWVEVLDAWLPAFLRVEFVLPDGARWRLCELTRYKAELEFWFEARGVNTATLDRLVSAGTLAGAPRPALQPQALNGMLKGFIDLVFEWQGRYYVADYKSNWLGADAAAYTAEAMRETVLAKRYELQYALYLLALHRHLKDRLPDYAYERHVGGAVYVFLRGLDGPARGLHLERPDFRLIQALDALFDGAEEVGDAA